MSAERTEATLQMLECDKEKLIDCCNDLEKENMTLKKSYEASQNSIQAALNQTSKVNYVIDWYIIAF